MSIYVSELLKPPSTVSNQMKIHRTKHHFLPLKKEKEKKRKIPVFFVDCKVKFLPLMILSMKNLGTLGVWAQSQHFYKLDNYFNG